MNDHLHTDQQFKQWLRSHYAEKTVENYIRDYHWYIEALGAERAHTAVYKDVLAYIGVLRSRYTRGATVRYYLSGVKAWHRFLVQSGERSDDPCRFLHLRDARQRDLQLDSFLTPQQLYVLVERTRGQAQSLERNRVVMSLLVYQGLSMSEIIQLRTSDIDFRQSSIDVRGGRRTNNRTLPLHPSQIMLLQGYINGFRASYAPPDVQELLVTKDGKAMRGVNVYELVQTQRPLLSGRMLSVTLIRQSVIRNQLYSGMDARLVQAFCGHKQTSTTNRYKQQQMKLLQRSIDLYHPLQ